MPTEIIVDDVVFQKMLDGVITAWNYGFESDYYVETYGDGSVDNYEEAHKKIKEGKEVIFIEEYIDTTNWLPQNEIIGRILRAEITYVFNEYSNEDGSGDIVFCFKLKEGTQ